jgi:type III pantothenate kinase
MNATLVAAGIGNTTTRIGIASNLPAQDLPVWSARAEFSTADLNWPQLAALVAGDCRRWLVASVQRAAQQRLQDWIRRERPADEYLVLGHRDLPIEVDVESPERVGMDRLAAAVAANRLRRPGRPAIVVDAGTAITVNLVSADGIFRGGVILPGFRLTARALAEGTDLLPLVTADLAAEPPPIIGRSTESAIRSGLFWGNVGAVREIVKRVAHDLACPPQVFVTGGDAQRLAGCIATDARYVPELVLIGIASCPAATAQGA